MYSAVTLLLQELLSERCIIMNTVKFDKANVKMIAHRGLSGIECENTNAAFVAAGNRSYFGIETDVHVTSDGKFAIIHDDATGRVCEKDIPVEESNLSELQGLTLKKPGLEEFRLDYCIPELREYIGICKKYEKVCVLELKNDMSQDAIEGIADVVLGEGYLDSTIFISFHWENLIILRKLIPGCKVQFLVNKCDDHLVGKLDENRIGLDIYWKSVTPELIEKIHSVGLEINCWTVDEAKDAERLALWGVDYITSNILE